MTKQRVKYWNHFVERYFVDSYGGGHGITGPRLKKVKSHIMQDDVFWQDVIYRHNGQDRSPEEMMKDSPETYQHCLGNFWGMLMSVMRRQNIIK